ncbi:MAG TPA: SH3 domain-containing protein [Spirillospora sp.]|nr:SH3 domain-containing protein [Spirillospora sp.]
MRPIGVLIFIISAACNLATIPPTPTPTQAPVVTVTDSPPPVATITLIGAVAEPTRLPLPGLPATAIPVTSVPSLGSLCQVYTTYSGARADNVLSLRSDPSTEAQQIFRVPNNVQVLRVPGSPEVEADGYHWLNVIYVDTSQMRYLGWIARDSFEVNGVRDPSVATLRPGNTQVPC